MNIICAFMLMLNRTIVMLKPLDSMELKYLNSNFFSPLRKLRKLRKLRMQALTSLIP